MVLRIVHLKPCFTRSDAYQGVFVVQRLMNGTRRWVKGQTKGQTERYLVTH